MADFLKATALNKAGKYYVDSNCICCGICTLIAPHNIFVYIKDEYGYVGKQPDTTEEINAITKAIQNCPVNAIGDDGKEGNFNERIFTKRFDKTGEVKTDNKIIT